MMLMVKKLWNEERGQGMTEYGLILALLVVGVISVMSLMGPKLVDQFEAVDAKLGPSAP